jgi:hypothetical protein
MEAAAEPQRPRFAPGRPDTLARYGYGYGYATIRTGSAS